MTRPAVSVRPATVDDLPDLEPLWVESVATLGTGTAVAAVERLVRNLARGQADQQVVVAVSGRATVGLMSYAIVDAGPWEEGPSMLIGVLHVSGKARRRGVAKALLGWAAARADEAGCSDVSVQVPPSMRDGNRFFARFGFAPVVTRRATTPAALRRRVGSDNRRLVDLRLRQRSLRRRAAAPHPPVPTAVAAEAD